MLNLDGFKMAEKLITITKHGVDSDCGRIFKVEYGSDKETVIWISGYNSLKINQSVVAVQMSCVVFADIQSLVGGFHILAR